MLDHVKPLGCQHHDPTAWTIQLHQEAMCGESVQESANDELTCWFQEQRLQAVAGSGQSVSSSLCDRFISAYMCFVTVRTALTAETISKRRLLLLGYMPKHAYSPIQAGSSRCVQVRSRASPGAQRPPPCCSTTIILIRSVLCTFDAVETQDSGSHFSKPLSIISSPRRGKSTAREQRIEITHQPNCT